MILRSRSRGTDKASKAPTPPTKRPRVAPRLTGEIRSDLGSQLGQLYAMQEPHAPPPAMLDLIAKLTSRLTCREDAANQDFRDGIVAALPGLRAFAISMTRSHHRADDLVQETVLKALRYSRRFERGTNLNGWLFTILRNQFHDEFRRRKREVEDVDGIFASKLAAPAEQEERASHQDLLAALDKLTPEQREALVLIGAGGMSYEDAAVKCRVPIGTIKSRLNRARARLAALLSLDPEAAKSWPARSVHGL